MHVEVDGFNFSNWLDGCGRAAFAIAARRLTPHVLVVLLGIASAGPARGEDYTFTHLAGSLGGAGYHDGAGNVARFNWPGGVAVDGSGNVYVADRGNHAIRRVSSSGEVTTLAGLAGSSGATDGIGGAARFKSPSSLAIDGAGNVYVADRENHTIRRVTRGGAVTTFAGRAGMPGSSDGIGNVARFNSPEDVAIDQSGNLYVADLGNQTIRKVTAGGEVTTLAGKAGSSGGVDGTGSAARFSFPRSVAVDGAGSVYVADSQNHVIRKVTSGGVVTTLAGMVGVSGAVDGIGGAARFSSPLGVAVENDGDIYVADGANYTIRRVTSGGGVTTIAGVAGSFGSVDGPGTSARFGAPENIDVDGVGNIYVVDNHTVRKVTAEGMVTTLAGLAPSFGSDDGNGSAARFRSPAGIAMDGGNLYVADTSNHTIRKVTTSGIVTTLAGVAGQSGSTDGIGSVARFKAPGGIAVDGSGNVYVADTGNGRIRKVSSTGVVTTLAGDGSGSSSDGSPPNFFRPGGLAVDIDGNVYVAESYYHTIRKVTSAGVVSTLAGLRGVPGSSDGTGSAARFRGPEGVALDAAGNLYVTDTMNHTIRKVTKRGEVTTLAGRAGSPDSHDDFGINARFILPSGVATDRAGNVYVSEVDASNTIRKVSSDGAVSTIGGQTGRSGSSDGTGVGARFHAPQALAVDNAGNLFVADSRNHKIRSGAPALADMATIDAASGPAGRTRYLGASPSTATSWEWSLVRRPSGSTATLSAADRDPVFTPDVADLFVFRLIASNGGAKRFSFISLATGLPSLKGDVNGDGEVSATDVFYLINHLFGGGPAPLVFADMNGDTSLSVADIFYLISFLFTGGPAPL